MESQLEGCYFVSFSFELWSYNCTTSRLWQTLIKFKYNFKAYSSLLCSLSEVLPIYIYFFTFFYITAFWHDAVKSPGLLHCISKDLWGNQNTTLQNTVVAPQANHNTAGNSNIFAFLFSLLLKGLFVTPISATPKVPSRYNEPSLIFTFCQSLMIQRFKGTFFVTYTSTLQGNIVSEILNLLTPP